MTRSFPSANNNFKEAVDMMKGWLPACGDFSLLLVLLSCCMRVLHCMCCLCGKGQHSCIALGMVHNGNKSAIGTCIPEVIDIMFFRCLSKSLSSLVR